MERKRPVGNWGEPDGAKPRKCRDIMQDSDESVNKKLLAAAVQIVKRKGDVSAAEWFATLYRDRLRYCHPWGTWLVWDGARWRRDDAGEVVKLAKSAVAKMYLISAHEGLNEELRPALRGAAAIIESREGKLLAMIRLAESELPVRPDELDRDPWLLNVANGTIDLRTGERREHRPGDLITKLAPVPHDTAAVCPHWDRFIGAVLPDPDTRQFFQRFGGYCLTGSVREQLMTVMFGGGANGKTTAINAVMDVLGFDYGIRTAPDLVMCKRNETHPTDRADLFGRRLAIVSETEDGKRMAESFVKDATGGDRMWGRRLYHDGFEFEPTHKIVVATNHLPEIRGTDEGIWRRLRIVPFVARFWNPDTDPPGRAELKQDKELADKLRAERSGILNWLLTGCHDWQTHRMPASREMQNLCGEYRTEQDTVGQFLTERCSPAPGHLIGASGLYDAYRVYTVSSGILPVNTKQFSKAVQQHGFNKITSNGVKYVGLKLITEGTEGTEGYAGNSL